MRMGVAVAALILLGARPARAEAIDALGDGLAEMFMPILEVMIPDLRLEIPDDGDAALVVSFPLGWTLYDHDFDEELSEETGRGLSFLDVRHFVEPQIRVGPGDFYMGTGVRVSAGRNVGGLLETGFFVGEPGTAAFVGGGFTTGPADGKRASFIVRRVFEEDASRFDICFDLSYHY